MKLIFVLLLFAVFYLPVAAQTEGKLSKNEIKKLEKDGEFFFEKEDYQGALGYFLKLHEDNLNEPYYNLVIGICYTYNTIEKEKALDYLEKARELNPDFELINLYIGRAYYKNLEFQRSLDLLTDLVVKGEVDNIAINEANQLIEYCENALIHTADSLENVRVINLGSVINTSSSEYAPIVTPDESRLIFTYKGEKSIGGKMNDKGEPDEHGKYYEDIYISFKSPDDWMYDEDVWLEPKSISINTDIDDASIALSLDGQTIYLYKYTQENGGDIYSSHLDGTVWSELKPLEGLVNTRHWEGSMSIASNGRILYFSSDKPGGYGKRDLYRAEMMDNGTWGNVENLGPTINTPLNDDAPYLHLDRKTLYFSSQGHNSMGGYDVYFTTDNEGSWMSPINMGTPVNTTEDDLFYIANADGGRGYYSTNYGKNSYGQQDIYLVTPDVGKLDLDPIAALVLGIVYADDIPTASEIIIRDITNNVSAGNFTSNSASGEYRIALLPGAKYEMEVKAKNYPSHFDEINLETLHEYIEVSNNIYLYSEEYAEANEVKETKSIETAMVAVVVAPVVVVPEIKPDVVPEIKPDVVPEIKPDVVPEIKPDIVVIPPPVIDSPCDDMIDLFSFVGLNLNIETNYNRLKSKIGEYCADELHYKVQIGAYRFPQNFKYANLNQFGEAKIKDYPDGITRFTLGQFITLNEADDLRQKIRAAGTEDAWVIPFYDGQRIFMEDLISVNFYKQMVN